MLETETVENEFTCLSVKEQIRELLIFKGGEASFSRDYMIYESFAVFCMEKYSSKLYKWFLTYTCVSLLIET